MRRLLSFSDGGKIFNFKWEEITDTGTDVYTMVGKELPDPELREASMSLILLFQSIFNQPGKLEDISKKVAVEKVSLKYEETADPKVFNRLIRISSLMFIDLSIGGSAVMKSPFIKDTATKLGYLPEGKLAQLIDRLEHECFKYIDGSRAQMRLDFEAKADDEEDDRAKLPKKAGKKK